MKRFELYIDNYERLSIAVFEDIEAEYESAILHGEESYDLIKRLAANPIIDFYKYKMRDEAVIEYKNYIINLNDYSKIVKKRGMGALTKPLKNFLEVRNMKNLYPQTDIDTSIHYQSNIKPPKQIDEEKIQRIMDSLKVEYHPKQQEKTINKPSTSKKVKRRNKYKGKIIAGILVATLILGGCVCCEMQSLKAHEFNNNQTTTIYKDEGIDFEKINKYDKEENEIFDLSDIIKIKIDYEDNSMQDKVRITKEKYGDLIYKYATQYGIDPNLVLAIATQERGIHSTEKDKGGATGLMQIQNSVWEDEIIYAYNYRLNQKESFYITKSNISDLETNIKIGCMYLQNCMEYMNYNVVAATQCYNMGFGSMKKILESYSRDTNKSINEILADKYDMGWLEYRDLITKGDKNYVEHVFSWLGSEVEFTIISKNNGMVVSNITNSNVKKIS